MNKAPFKRYTEGYKVLYDVLSSKRTFYYTVEMLGLTAISCECDGNAKYKKHCGHMRTAEQAETEFQQNSVELPKHFDGDNSVEERYAQCVLNGNKEFSLLKR